MSDLQNLIVETVEDVCDHFCKYSGTGDKKRCVYVETHSGECPFDELLKEIENDKLG